MTPDRSPAGALHNRFLAAPQRLMRTRQLVDNLGVPIDATFEEAMDATHPVRVPPAGIRYRNNNMKIWPDGREVIA